MMEYFKPLMTWLEEQNKRRQVGWDYAVASAVLSGNWRSAEFLSRCVFGVRCIFASLS
jgi:hypothetical protein